MQVVTAVIISSATLLTGILSAIITFKGQTQATAITAEDVRLDHNDSLLAAYSKMVEDLRQEVQRLNSVIAEMRKDQDECDRRNNELSDEVDKMRLRISELEKR